MTHNERVNHVVAQTLGIEVDELSESSHLVNDLGAESIDFLDMTFRLEREFDIKIPRDELFPESVFQENPGFIQNGKITDDGIARLKTALPYADNFGHVEDQRTVESVKDLFTVGLIYNYVDWKLKV